MCDALIDISVRSYNVDCFFRILGSIKMNFGQILVHFMTNISKSLLALLLRLKVSSKPFYDFERMAK